MLLFLALCCFAATVAGGCAFLIFWPLTLIHLRERHPALASGFGDGAFLKPTALRWLLCRRYRERHDRALSGLATPAWLALLTSGLGLGLSALLGFFSQVMQ